MRKKIAVVISDRQSEAFRMSVGLTLVDDVIDLFLLNDELEYNEQNNLNLELMQEMDMKIYSNNLKNKNLKYLSLEDMAKALTNYDHVISY